jgi:uncharacterized protein (TIGR02996 family)
VARREDFEAALDLAPDDWALRRVYADWLEEQGDYELAHAQRWMAVNRKHPRQWSDCALDEKPWRWFVWVHIEQYHESRGHAYEDLPRDLARGLTPKHPYGHIEYADRRAAEADLARALAQTQNAPAG